MLADRRAPGPFTTRFYNDPSPKGSKPVWGIAPEAIIVSPDPRRELVAGREIAITGWARAETEVASVEVSTDGGTAWRAADLEPRVRLVIERKGAMYPLSLSVRPR
jgi:hypothetical protein